MENDGKGLQFIVDNSVKFEEREKTRTRRLVKRCVRKVIEGHLGESYKRDKQNNLTPGMTAWQEAYHGDPVSKAVFFQLQVKKGLMSFDAVERQIMGGNEVEYSGDAS